MRIATVGLWHLGSVYATGLAELGHDVLALDPDPQRIADYRAGRPPVAEPGLAELIATMVDAGRLQFSADLEDLAAGPFDCVWITADTPVDDSDQADTGAVLDLIAQCLRHLPAGTVLAYSSQLPLGCGDRIAAAAELVHPGIGVRLVCSPENLRLGTALTAFRQPQRVVIGSDDPHAAQVVADALSGCGAQQLVMSRRSAELSKHALNGFLALSVAYANELARLADATGADAGDVHRALASDPRIGPRAYLRPGGPIAGGTLARDVNYLQHLAAAGAVAMPITAAVLPSNDAHKRWAVEQAIAAGRPGAAVAVVGLAYKAGTDTLRRSYGVEVLDALGAAGMGVLAGDSRVSALPERLAGVDLRHPAAIDPAAVGVIVLCADDPALGELWRRVCDHPDPPVVVDAVGALELAGLDRPQRIRVLAPGRVASAALPAVDPHPGR